MVAFRHICKSFFYQVADNRQFRTIFLPYYNAHNLLN